MRSGYWLAAVGIALSGCARAGAPTFGLFGSWFPAWLLCGVIGVLAGVAARIAMISTGLAQAIPAQLLLCSAVGLIVACLLWLWLGQ